MENKNFDIDKYLLAGTKSAKDYILLVRNNLKIVILISFAIIALATVYAILAKNIYKSTVTIRITPQNQNVLESSTEEKAGQII